MDGLASHHPPSAAYWSVRLSMLEWSAVRQVQLTGRLDPTYSIGWVEAPSSVCEPLLLRPVQLVDATQPGDAERLVRKRVASLF